MGSTFVPTVNGMDQRIVDRAHLHVRRALKGLAPYMHFHDLDHTLSVARTATEIGQALKVPQRDLRVLEVAALFHDLGYLDSYTGHETHSMARADAFLRKEGVDERTIQRVRKLILATTFGAAPHGLLQRILKDADSAKAGQLDFEDRSERLRMEQEQVRGKAISTRSWLKEDLRYLSDHRFYTSYARERFGRQKALNLQHLQYRLSLPKKEDHPMVLEKERFHDRDLSWLSFNERVLQEAMDPRVPLLERVKFLGIFSNNLDEFYRVRVASLRSLTKLRKGDRNALEIASQQLVARINRKTLRQQQRFGALYREVLLPALAEKGIRILRPEELSAAQRGQALAYFTEQVAPLITTAEVLPGNAPFIEDRKLYLVCTLARRKNIRKQRLVLLNLPSQELGRFLVLRHQRKRDTDILFLDDVVRLGLKRLFPKDKVVHCHAVKLSRDADLHLEEEFAETVVEKVRKSLRKRQTGVPSRFLFDATMPATTLQALRHLLRLKKADLVPGGRYHNFSDMLSLPIEGYEELKEPAWPPVRHPRLRNAASVTSVVGQGDLMLHFPYHDFGQVLKWLEEAAVDPTVEHIAISIYRVAKGSLVGKALLKALSNKKRVTVFVEVQARFDERSNLVLGEALQQAGAEVLYSHEGLKVHAKVCMVERTINGQLQRQAYLGTGNFHEGTARIYVDTALLTANPRITREVAQVFQHLRERDQHRSLDHLLLAPTDLRRRVEAMIDKEIANALSGRPSGIFLKLNSLEDKDLIRKLYAANAAGVPMRIVVRGICCLVPGIAGLSDGIEVRSIVDRYLEHTRVYVFHNAGRKQVYLSSADWMGRNMDRRVEVAFPIQDKALKQEVLDLLEIQWQDNVKARIVDARQRNKYVKPAKGADRVRAQAATYTYLGGHVAPRAASGRGKKKDPSPLSR